MNLSLSVRIAESFLSKEKASMGLDTLAPLAAASGYSAVCMRASQVGVQSDPEAVREAREILRRHGLSVSMVTGDFDIVYNNDAGPDYNPVGVSTSHYEMRAGSRSDGIRCRPRSSSSGRKNNLSFCGTHFVLSVMTDPGAAPMRVVKRVVKFPPGFSFIPDEALAARSAA